jgi:hypothetical protein
MWEAEFESMEERLQFWEEWGAQPKAQEFMEKLVALVDSTVSREIWHMA